MNRKETRKGTLNKNPNDQGTYEKMLNFISHWENG